MIEHRVEITDSKGQSVKIALSLAAGTYGRNSWRTLDNGYFRFEHGVADTGHYPTSSLAWIALYGGTRIDDNKLVLHLDDFMGFTQANSSGKGKVYKQDYILMEPGEISWRLLS